ncbi:hypothetical protein NUU61_005169 [Penicillium alfredii]|uniref:Uncharacterized protein n=1 Tax=Penicillium alfredii TaxID=1506179 RepID=A0A9W9F919_9EURO|nr:uncharacterized protein NUU61_005169 [Penicillium alfredii]KAJ5095813.1 hypothetical protein NUU61_005169 [Penicillium alfredii]
MWDLIRFLCLVGTAHAAVIRPVPHSEPTQIAQDMSAAVVSSPTVRPTARIKLEPSSTRNYLQARTLTLPVMSSKWTDVSCSDGLVSDQNPQNMTERYEKAQVPLAWKDLWASWSKYNNSDKHSTGVPETFMMYVGRVFYDKETMDCGQIGDVGCDGFECEADGKAPATYLIMNGFAFMNIYFTKLQKAFYLARDDVYEQMPNFVKLCANIDDESAWVKSMLDIGLFSSLAFIPVGFSAMAAAEVVAANSVPASLVTNMAISGSVFVHNMVENYMKSKTNDDETQSLRDLARSIVEKAGNAIIEYLHRMTSGRKDVEEDLRQLITTGILNTWYLEIRSGKEDGGYLDFQSKLAAGAKQGIFGQIIIPAWRKGAKKANPFILRIDRKDYKCKDPVSQAASHLELDKHMSNDVKDKTIWCDKDGNSFFLLDAHIETNVCSTQNGCGASETYGFFALDGGTDKDLEPYNLHIKDFVLATYGAYKLNGNKNGYIPDQTTTKEVQDDFSVKDNVFPGVSSVRTPGFFNLTVCLNAKVAADNLKNNKIYNFAPCQDPQDEVTVSQPVNSNDYTSGNCMVHVTQWRDLGDGTKNSNNNPLKNTQLAISITDSTDKLVLHAPKQPLYGTLAVTSPEKNKGLSNSLVTTLHDGKLVFWYRDIFWDEDSPEHRCDFGAYDSGDHAMKGDETRQGQCMFHCGDPTKTAPDSVPSLSLQHVPSQQAYLGTGGNKNIETSDFGIDGKGKGFKGGWCTMHIRTYEAKLDSSKYNWLNSDSDYALELTIYDAKKNMIAYQSETYGDTTVQGLLPYIMIATAPKDTQGHVSFKYAGQSFHTGDKDHCGNCGDYDRDLFMDCDCGFSCAQADDKDS